jgi:ferredoxin
MHGLRERIAVVNLDRCVGCGNCVAICPSSAGHLRKKEEETIPVKDKDAYYMKLLQSRQGKQGIRKLE